ncbi:S41 family peptidase [Yoonia sp. 2307UL14-13]|uniref:S41 family peptidase n=1 Tax=Yoonia sp. 2307UL14-13 TaxID=3126506 RepID=UPI00309A728E
MIRPLKWVLGAITAVVAIIAVSWFVYKPNSQMRGTWKTEGYGLHLDIGPAIIDLYQVTDVSCMRVDRLPAHLWLLNALEEVEITAEADRLRIDAGGVINPIHANPITALPDLCSTPPASPGTAQENFDVFWHAMAEHYAFFDLHGIDWAARRTRYRPDTDTVLDDDALFDLFKQALAGLNDGHLYIATTQGEVHSPETRPEWHEDRHMVRDNTLAQFNELTAIDGSGILYGWAAEGIGYVYLTQMRADGGLNRKTADAARSDFANVARAFANAKGIIIDVRYNPGGSDDVSLAYASYFTDQERPALSKTIRTETGYTDPLHVSVRPSGETYLTQPTVVLTTGFTGSAAEIFTMAMRELPQVTVLGTPTSGGLSDVLDFSLPNGWELGLSHQRYFTSDGRLYERIGIPPDLTVAVDVEKAKDGIDTQLDAAIAFLNDG